MEFLFFYIAFENGLIFWKKIRNINGLNLDLDSEDLLGGIISAFQSFAKTIFNSHIQKITMKNYSLIIRPFTIQTMNLFCIVGVDDKPNRKLLLLDIQIRKLIRNLQSRIDQKHININPSHLNFRDLDQLDLDALF